MPKDQKPQSPLQRAELTVNGLQEPQRTHAHEVARDIEQRTLNVDRTAVIAGVHLALARLNKRG